MREFTYGSQRHIDDAPGPGPDEPMTPVEQRDTAYRRRKAFLRSLGLPNAKLTNGRPDRPSNRPERRAEYRRRWYIRKVARENGISEAAAEYIVPRRPGTGRRHGITRDEAGRFLASTKRAG